MATFEKVGGVRFDEGESAPVRQVRTTVLVSSLAAVRAHGKFDAYLKLVSDEHRSTILSLSQGAWVPVAVAEAHYGALDRCGFSNSEMVAIGEETFGRLDRTSLGGAIAIAKQFGATPWTALLAAPAMFERGFVGGGMGVFKVGPKDARVEFRGVSIVRFLYVREAWRGIFIGGLKRFSTRLFVREIIEQRTNTRWAVAISWV